MTKTELLNKIAQDPDERLLLARVMDKMDTARLRGVPTHTPFLSPAEREAAQRLIAACGAPRHLFWGGFEGAERTVCAFLPDWMEPEDWEGAEDCPVAAIQLSYPGDTDLTHRDFLGSVLGLGITREKVGDLLVGDGACQVVLLREMEDVLLTQLDQVGRVKVKTARCPVGDLTPPEQTTRLIRDTVATLRLDAVASSGFSTSRGKMADYITGKKVALNGKDCDKPDRSVVQGDVITCRGLGKCVVKEVMGQSKKGRIMLVLERYM